LRLLLQPTRELAPNLQDWRTWLDNGFLDALCPMASGVDAAQMEARLTDPELEEPIFFASSSISLTPPKENHLLLLEQ